MPNYRVHMWTKVRVTIDIPEAIDQQEAMRQAKRLDLDRLLKKDRWPTTRDGRSVYADTDYADEGIEEFLVDEIGDVEHEKSRYYDHDGNELQIFFEEVPTALPRRLARRARKGKADGV